MILVFYNDDITMHRRVFVGGGRPEGGSPLNLNPAKLATRNTPKVEKKQGLVKTGYN